MSKRCLTLILLCLLSLPAAAQAMPCHCFNDREFDPGQPFAADPYYLVTAQNSLFSVVFGIEKKQVVFAKQKPRATSEGLWVAYWAAQKLGLRPGKLLKARYRSDSWKAALHTVGSNRAPLGEDFNTALAADAADGRLSELVVNDILEARKAATRQELDTLRKGGASDAQTIMAALLGLKTGRPASQFYKTAKAQKTSWGTLLLQAGLNGTDILGEVEALLSRAAR